MNSNIFFNIYNKENIKNMKYIKKLNENWFTDKFSSKKTIKQPIVLDEVQQKITDRLNYYKTLKGSYRDIEYFYHDYGSSSHENGTFYNKRSCSV